MGPTKAGRELTEAQQVELLHAANETERKRDIERFPKEMGDHCLVARSLREEEKGNPIIMLSKMESNWEFQGVVGNKAYVTNERGQRKPIDTKHFWAMNFMNSDFVLDELKEDHIDAFTEGRQKEYNPFVEAFFKGEISQIITYISRKMEEYQQVVEKYESETPQREDEKELRKKIQAVSVLIERRRIQGLSLGPLQKRLEDLTDELRALFPRDKISVADYIEASEHLEKHITALHNLLFIEQELQKVS